MIRLSRKLILNKKFIKLYVTTLALVGIVSIVGIAKASTIPTITLSQNTNISATGSTTLTVTGSGLAVNSDGGLAECNDDLKTQPTVVVVSGYETSPVSCTDPLVDFVETTSSGVLVAENGTSAATLSVKEGVVGPPKNGTDSNGKSASADAALYPCPPTAAQIALGDTCIVKFGDDGPNDSAKNQDNINVPITFAGQTLTTPKVTLSLLSSSATYGSEQKEKISATVVPAISSGIVVPTIKVMSGLTNVCTISLTTESSAYMASSKGSCLLSASLLKAGSYKLVGDFSAGAVNYKNSSSASVSLVIKKAISKTTLKASVLKLTYGKEQTEKLTVSVAPTYATGTVTIKSGSVTLCKLTHAVNASTVSCYLTKSQLSVGTHKVLATFSGNTNVNSSSSASTTLTVVKS